MDKVVYLTLEQVLVIHEDQIERYGGTSGLRDLSLLESAIFRPQSNFSGADLYKTLYEKGAALMHSIIKNHPFVDGNKRTGIVAAFVFLKLNMLEITVERTQLVKIALRIEMENWNIEKIAKLLEGNQTSV